MGAIRVTQGIMVQRVLRNLSNQSRTILSLQEELATGLRVNDLSDNPNDARRAISTRASIRENEQYLDNMATAGPFLDEAVSSIGTANEAVVRAYELALQGANGTYSDDDLATMAEEVNQIIEEMVTAANHQTNNRYIFGGTATTDAPFVATRDANGWITGVTYEGNDETINVAISDGVSVVVNAPGSEVFQGSGDVFQTLINLRDDLVNGNQSDIQDVQLAALQTNRKQFMNSMARLGAIQTRIDNASSDIEDFNLQLEELLSDSIDADYADTVLNLTSQSNAFQAALSAAANVIQPSLIDYLG